MWVPLRGFQCLFNPENFNPKKELIDVQVQTYTVSEIPPLILGVLGVLLLLKNEAHVTVCVNFGTGTGTGTLNTTPVQGGIQDDPSSTSSILSTTGGTTPNNFEMVFQGVSGECHLGHSHTATVQFHRCFSEPESYHRHLQHHL